MSKSKESAESSPAAQADIIVMLSKKARELADLHSTAVKYPALKALLASTVAELPVDTRLPGIRDLAQTIGTSLVTTQRAVTELVNEGVLYSRSRAGVFVRNQVSPPTAEPSTRGTRHPFQVEFDFGTDSTALHQRKFWEGLAGLFCKQHPNTTPSLHFEANVLQGAKPLDVYEGYDWNRHYNKGANDILDISGFAGSLLPVTPNRDGLLPLYHRTYFLFFNRSLLERHGLPLPDFRTFEEQTKYLELLAPELARLGFNPKPYSIQEPVTLFGGKISHFSKTVDERQAEASPELIHATEKLITFCRLCQYSFKDRNEWVSAQDEFLKGQAPFFMGYSVDYWEFFQKKLSFSLGVYPTLCCDDTFFLWTRVGAIARNSEHPVESINFLLFLLRPEIQERFAATGNFGANGANHFHPRMSADDDWVTGVLQKSLPFHLATRERYYTAVNILGGEIWRSLLEDVSTPELLKRAIQLARSYLQHRSERES